MSADTNEVQAKKKTLQELISLRLCVPDYQRRYCWSEKQVSQLLQDIGQLVQQADKNVPLFLGTLIVHKKGDDYNLVDGQQRCLTLVLILKALYEKAGEGDCQLKGYASLMDSKFGHSLSQQYLALNYQKILAYFQADTPTKAKEKHELLLKNLEFVVITIHLIDQAFTFFDSQNSAGKRLSDFDLLKARHLRGLVGRAEIGIACSDLWEGYERLRLGPNAEAGAHLAYFMTENILANSRTRQRNQDIDRLQLEDEFPVLTAPKDEAREYHLVQLSAPTNSSFYRDWKIEENLPSSPNKFPFLFKTTLNIAGNDNFMHESKVDQLPLQMYQPLMGGEQFFIYIAKYAEIYKQLFPNDKEKKKNEGGEVSGVCDKLLTMHRQIQNGQSAGYSRLIDIWISLVIFYVDRFEINGTEQEKSFTDFIYLSELYVFSLRITLESLRRASVEKHFRENKLFNKLYLLPTPESVNTLIASLLEEQVKEVRNTAAIGNVGWAYTSRVKSEVSIYGQCNAHCKNMLNAIGLLVKKVKS